MELGDTAINNSNRKLRTKRVRSDELELEGLWIMDVQMRYG